MDYSAQHMGWYELRVAPQSYELFFLPVPCALEALTVINLLV